MRYLKSEIIFVPNTTPSSEVGVLCQGQVAGLRTTAMLTAYVGGDNWILTMEGDNGSRHQWDEETFFKMLNHVA